MISINIVEKLPQESSVVVLATAESDFETCGFSEEETEYLHRQITEKAAIISFATGVGMHSFFVVIAEKKNTLAQEKEKMRKKASEIHQVIIQQKIKSITIVDIIESADLVCAFAEGLVLTNYQFLEYSTKRAEKEHSLLELNTTAQLNKKDIDFLNISLESVYKVRDLVNHPAKLITAKRLNAEFVKMAEETGFSVQVFEKDEISAMKMGGLLAVNQGSTEPPTFSILQWKPDFAKNKRPIVLVGKAVTYDTGGHNIKTGDYMTYMKGDMAGGATVAAVVAAVAKAKLPIHVIALVPATDNRLSADAISPGDIIYMYDGTSVEVVNTDAEGRLILADALVYAENYEPQVVICVATLTGAAERALGDKAMAAMCNTDASAILEKLKTCGEEVHEKIVEFPLWEEYAEDLKSNVADMKNVGGNTAGMITAGKFLEHFTSYPFIHLDIAGVAFAEKPAGYRGHGGTGTGFRLLFDFLKKYAND